MFFSVCVSLTFCSSAPSVVTACVCSRLSWLMGCVCVCVCVCLTFCSSAPSAADYDGSAAGILVHQCQTSTVQPRLSCPRAWHPTLALLPSFPRREEFLPDSLKMCSTFLSPGSTLFAPISPPLH